MMREEAVHSSKCHEGTMTVVMLGLEARVIY